VWGVVSVDKTRSKNVNGCPSVRSAGNGANSLFPPSHGYFKFKPIQNISSVFQHRFLMTESIDLPHQRMVYGKGPSFCIELKLM
jgi:hypothetical protein